MNQLVVRRLLIDLETPFPARWNGGDAFRSALFNALSMSFPAGEQFFIDSVRTGLNALPSAERVKYADEVQGFIGQEATHRRIHTLFNGHLERLGYDNEIERRTVARRAANAHRDPRMHAAATAATEHFTAIFADWLLRHPEVLAGAEPRLQTLWRWHSAEESEHRCTAFDIHLAQRRPAAVRQGRADPRQHGPVAQLPGARLPPEPACCQPVAAVAARQRGPVRSGRGRWRQPMTAALAVGRSPGVEFKPTRGATPRVAETLRADPDRRYPAISDLDQVTN